MFTAIRLQHFRSYDDASFELGSGVNIIVGPNASGKTNLLEAIMVSALGGSYRVRDPDLLQFAQEWARLDVDSPDGRRVVKLQADPIGQVRKSFVIDERSYQRLSVQKTVPAVLFEPNHLLMLTGTPDMRRAFMDDLIEQAVAGYATLRRNYRRALAQRNALLKQGEQVAGPQLFAWNVRLSELGGQIARERMRLLARMSHHAGDIYSHLAGRSAAVEIGYKTSCELGQYESSLLHRLEASLSRDCLLGFTTSGPHRDDMAVQLNGHEIAESASRGEARTLVLALKVIELRLLHEIRGRAPLLLLDDVFSELDGARRQALTSYLADYQVFITTTDADVVVKHFIDSCTIIPLGR